MRHISGRLLFGLLLCALPLPAEVLEVVLAGEINPVSSRFLTRQIDRAARERAELILVELDTPGGLATSMDQMVQKILGSEVPVAVYVYPPGARAASAGVFLAMAAQVAAMAPGTHLGAAHPVTVGASGSSPQGGTSTMEQKILQDAVAEIRSLAKLRGRNADWAEQAVRQSAALTEGEALKQNVVDMVAPTPEGLLERLDGRTLPMGSGLRVLHTRGLPLRRVAMGPIERLLDAIVQPNVAYLLFLLGTLGLLFELTTPGIGAPGVAGGIAVLLALVAFGSLSINLGGLLLLILAAVLFIVDLKAPTHGVLTAGAIAAMLLGSFLLFPPWRMPPLPGAPRLRVSPWLILLMTGLFAAFFATMLSFGLRAQSRKVLTGLGSLAGKEGVALTDLTPGGQVRVAGEEWSATAVSGNILRGEEVQVVGVEGLRLQVRRKPSGRR